MAGGPSRHIPFSTYASSVKDITTIYRTLDIHAHISLLSGPSHHDRARAGQLLPGTSAAAVVVAVLHNV